MSGCFGLGDYRVQLNELPWIHARIVGISRQVQTSITASFSFASIISALSNLCPSGRIKSLANSTFYLRTVLFGDGCVYSNASYGATFFSSDTPTFMGPPGCTGSGTNPDFVQWANVSCDSDCTCVINASGRLGNYGSNRIVGSAQGCNGSWQVTNGWVTGTSGNYQLGLFFGGIAEESTDDPTLREV